MTGSSGRKASRPAFTLIELLVVVAIIALLISILLPSLSKAREQAKAAVCSSGLQQFGRSLYIYEGAYKAVPPTDPWYIFPPAFDGQTRLANNQAYNWDPPHGYLAMYGMGVTPDVGDATKFVPALADRDLYPYDFKWVQEADVWEQFLCPSMNRRVFDVAWWRQQGIVSAYYNRPVNYNHAAAYLTNRNIRCATNYGADPVKPNLANPDPVDNMYGSSAVRLDLGNGLTWYDVQATNLSQVLSPAEVFYMADTFDENLDGNGGTGPLPYSYNAGDWRWHGPGALTSVPSEFDSPTMPLSPRHLGRSNVLWLDGHVDRENQVTRSKLGSRVLAVTWADVFDNDANLGNQHHLAPTGITVGRR